MLRLRMTMTLEQLKARYETLAKKHSLPLFKELNEQFEIERIEHETDMLLRVVRKLAMDKVVEVLRFVEALLNPTNSAPSFMMFARAITAEQRKKLESLYEPLMKLELTSLDCELFYREETEAALIRDVHKQWNGISETVRSVTSSLQATFDKKSSEKKERNYFG